MPPSHKRVEPEARPSFISTQVTEANRYYLNLAPEPGEGITVACGGCERMRPDYVIDRSDFPFLAVELVAEGCGSLWLGGGTYRLTPGVVFAYGPGVAHVIRNDPARPMLKYYVNFVGEAA